MRSRPFARLVAATATAVLLSAGPALALAPAAQSAAPGSCASDPVTAQRGAEPLCDTPNGRTFALDVAEASPGSTVDFHGTGFVRDAGGGQTLTLKLNDIDIIGSRIEAAADGTVDAQVTLPSQEVFDAYAEQYGTKRWWVRVLVGSGRADGADDAPSASLSSEFTLPADATPGGGTEDGAEDDAAADETAGGAGTTGPGSPTGKLPEAGLGDHPGLVAGIGLAALALAVIGLERRFRRRTTA